MPPSIALTTVILCGGRGQRAHPHTLEIPKPLMEVADKPILRHVMDIYASQGFTKFVLAAGFKWELIRDFAQDLPRAWDVHVEDTGEETDKADRILRCRDLVGDTFFATYSDGLGDIDLERLIAFHEQRAGSATVTVVPLPSPYGTIDCDSDGRVRGFVEKPHLEDHLINAGFFLFDVSAFDYWKGSDLENDVLPTLAAANQLRAYRHEGFWKSMDTYKDALDLDAMARSAHAQHGRPQWLSSAKVASS